MSLVIGLTGSIASGKSTVSGMLAERDIPVIDADVISREVVEPGETAYKKIVDLFGKSILFADGGINRKKLGEIVFKDKEKRKQLNEIVHPAVRKRMLAKRDELVAENEKLVVLDIPLLFESELTHFVDKVVVVYVNEEIQLNRLMERDGTSREAALSRINSQMSIEEKAKLADEVIDNSGKTDQTEKQLERLLASWNIPATK